jgi:WD40 repeat protein
MTFTSIAQPAASFQAHNVPVKRVRFSPSGRLVATGDTELAVKLWRDGEEVLRIDPKSHDDKIRPTENIRGIEFSIDETQIYIAASDTLNAYSTESGKLLWMYRPPRFLAFLIVSPQSIAVSSVGKVAASFDYGSIAVFNSNGNLEYRKSENYSPRRMGFSPQGKAIVGTDGFNLCVWKADDGALMHRWPLEQKVFALDVSKSEPLVVTRELHTMTLWDIDRFEKICELPSGRGLPTLAFSPTERVIVSGEKRRARLVNLECKGVRDFESDADILNITFSSDGSQIVAGCSDGVVRSWDRG